MGLITGLLTLPLAPLRGVVAAAEQVRQQAEEEYYDPVRIRAELTRVAEHREAGELSEAEATALEDELVDRLVAGHERHRGALR